MRAYPLHTAAVPYPSLSAQHRFTMLFQEVRPAVELYANYLCRYTSDPGTIAKDLVQDSLTVAWTRFNDLREGVRFKTWLISIMQRTYLNYSRAEQRHNIIRFEESETEDVADTTTGTTPIQIIMEMRHALLRLGPQERQALLLFTLGGLSIEELSRLQQCRPDCMKKRLERARTKMRSYMDDQTDGDNAAAYSDDILNETFKLLEDVLTEHSGKEAKGRTTL